MEKNNRVAYAENIVIFRGRNNFKCFLIFTYQKITLHYKVCFGNILYTSPKSHLIISKCAIFNAAQRERKEKMGGRFIRSLWIEFLLPYAKSVQRKSRSERNEQRANREKKEKRLYFFIYHHGVIQKHKKPLTYNARSFRYCFLFWLEWNNCKRFT